MIKKIRYVKSAEKVEDYPKELDRDIAMIGRSNVGKSSLINKLSNSSIARVSKTPGKTRYINFFEANDSFYIVDLPGYGFAKVSTEMKNNWKRYIEDYLLSPRKKIVFLLVDARRGLADKEFDMIEWLKYNNISHRIIYTKIDKLKRNELRTKKIKEENNIFLSSFSGEGIEMLQKLI